MIRKQLLTKKPLEMVLEDMQNHDGLRRTLGPIALTSLGVGAIIGTGIFIITGLAARQYAGPGLILSFIIAGLACTFAAFCYAEFASMAPVAGSAYTYAYLSLGELFAWMIGWDLLLEYSVASSSVAYGWSHYFLKFLGLFKDSAGKALVTIPLFLTCDPITATHQHADYLTATTIQMESVTALPYDTSLSTERLTLPVNDSAIHRLKEIQITFTDDSIAAVEKLHGKAKAADSIARVSGRLEEHLIYDPQADLVQALSGIAEGAKDGYTAYETTPIVFGGIHWTCNLLVIAVIMTLCVILVIGIRESTTFNAIMVFIKLAAVLFVIAAGVGHVDASNWSPFLPYGWGGVLGGAAIVFYAYIGFDSVSTHAEEAKNPNRDVPIGIIGSLVFCTLLYVAVSVVITGMVPYVHIPLDAPLASVFTEKGLGVAATVITVGALAGITSVLLVLLLSLPRVLMAMARDGLLPKKTFATVHPRFQTPWIGTIITCVFSAVVGSLLPLEDLARMVNGGTLCAFMVVCASVWIMRKTHPEMKRPFRVPCIWLVAPCGVLSCLVMLLNLGWLTWARLVGWFLVGMVIYFLYGRKHSRVGQSLRKRLMKGLGPSALMEKKNDDSDDSDDSGERPIPTTT